jgi:uncharacterized protein (TIGR02145 family)
MKKVIILLSILTAGCAKELVNYHGHIYNTIEVGNQRWMAENLQTKSYRWGRKIPVINDSNVWPDVNSRACGYFESDTSRLAKYGMLYNWKAVDEGKLCPLSWRVATNDDWNNLIETLGGEMRAGGKLKSVNGWKGKHISGDDIGFNATAGGFRLNGDFQEGYTSVWWSSTKVSAEDLSSLSELNNKATPDKSEIWILGRRLENTSSQMWTTANRPDNGFYVRCVKKK